MRYLNTLLGAAAVSLVACAHGSQSTKSHMQQSASNAGQAAESTGRGTVGVIEHAASGTGHGLATAGTAIGYGVTAATGAVSRSDTVKRSAHEQRGLMSHNAQRTSSEFRRTGGSARTTGRAAARTASQSTEAAGHGAVYAGESMSNTVRGREGSAARGSSHAPSSRGGGPSGNPDSR
jgi:hypothetical protein